MSLDTRTQPGTRLGTHTAEGIEAGSSAASGTPAGGRVQLALNVRDVDAAVEFYAKLFGVGPAKRRPGYANFAIAAPPLKLVLIEDPDARGDGVSGALNHLGVEVPSPAEVEAAAARLTGEGLATLTQDATSCCYAVQDKVWVHDPDGAPWEVYTVLADAPHDTSLTGASCTTVDRRCVPTDDAGDAELTGSGVPVAAASPAAAAAAAAEVGSSACCDSATAASCCAASAKSSCCSDSSADSTASAAGLLASCGCR